MLHFSLCEVCRKEKKCKHSTIKTNAAPVIGCEIMEKMKEGSSLSDKLAYFQKKYNLAPVK